MDFEITNKLIISGKLKNEEYLGSIIDCLTVRGEDTSIVEDIYDVISYYNDFNVEIDIIVSDSEIDTYEPNTHEVFKGLLKIEFSYGDCECGEDAHWKNEVLNIGGIDVLEYLTKNTGKYVHIELSYDVMQSLEKIYKLKIK